MWKLGSSALEKENSEFKPVKLRLKIDLVSYPVRAEGLVNMDKNVDIHTNDMKRILLRKFMSSDINDIKCKRE